MTTAKPKPEPNQFDEWVPDVRVQAEFNISAMTLFRWDQDEHLRELGFPPPIYMRGKKFRSRQLLEKFKASMLNAALSDRRNLRRVIPKGNARG
jgi:hypothetical protein